MGPLIRSFLIPLSLVWLAASALSAYIPASDTSVEHRIRAILKFGGSKELSFMKDYSEYQISDGYGGTAEEEAALVLIKPFEGVDLATVPYEVFDRLKLAKEEAEDIEVEVFEPAIERAGEDTPTGQALKVGLLKNRVLFATATVQTLEIEAAHNKAMGVEDPFEEDDLYDARAYLGWTIQADRENDGELSLGVT